MTYKEYTNLLNNTLENNKIDITSLDLDYYVKYHNETEEYEFGFNLPLGQVLLRGRVNTSIFFKLDFGSIQGHLNIDDKKMNIMSEDSRKAFAKVLSGRFNLFLEFSQWVGCFNGKKDYCDEIAGFIVMKRGAIFGAKYGLI
jgi:hypothetical protein